MSRTVAQQAARYAMMFPPEAFLPGVPTADERLAFDRNQMSLDSRNMAVYSARRNPVTAAACYAAIRRSL